MRDDVVTTGPICEYPCNGNEISAVIMHVDLQWRRTGATSGPRDSQFDCLQNTDPVTGRGNP
jgi:hypothetical protein